MGVTKISRLSDEQVDDLHRLYRNEWWTSEREREDVETMLAGSDLVVAFCDSRTEELVAFARALTDSVYKAFVFDVIVAPDRRGTGLGRRLMDEIVAHPALSGVEHYELYCLEEMVPFYEEWGFSDELGDLRLMRRE